MINSIDDARNAVLAKYDVGKHLFITQLEDEPEFWLVNPTDVDGNALIGGPAYVVKQNGRVFESTGSLPPRARIEDARTEL